MPRTAGSKGNGQATPLSGLVSKLLVAFTIEVDNEFESSMIKAGYTDQLSLVAWSNFLQYLTPSGVPISLIMERTFGSKEQVAQTAGTLERWDMVDIVNSTGASSRKPKSARPGWGTSKGIAPSLIVLPTDKGRAALKLWPRVISEVEERWIKRFGSSLGRLRNAMAAVVSSCESQLPDGVPSGWWRGDWRQFPSGPAGGTKSMPLHVLLSRTLLTLTIEFESVNSYPIALCANTLRVLTKTGVPVNQLHVLSGIPSQTTEVQCTALTKSKLALIAALSANPTGKGKIMRLTALGEKVQSDYLATSKKIEQSMKLSKSALRLRVEIGNLFRPSKGGSSQVIEGLRPPEGIRRSGAALPPLGLGTDVARRESKQARLGAAGETRNKELVAQTQAFLEDPMAALPEYPVWDQNRGFGP